LKTFLPLQPFPGSDSMVLVKTSENRTGECEYTFWHNAILKINAPLVDGS
jgi:hypothetical protein